MLGLCVDQFEIADEVKWLLSNASNPSLFGGTGLALSLLIHHVLPASGSHRWVAVLDVNARKLEAHSRLTACLVFGTDETKSLVFLGSLETTPSFGNCVEGVKRRAPLAASYESESVIHLLSDSS